MKTYKTIDEYISNYPKEVQPLLQKIRKTILAAAPQATETIGYGIPTFKLKGNLIHFGAYEHHIGLYPGSEVIEIFKKKLGDYKTAKGTIQFPLDKPIPYDLIKEITEFRVKKGLEKKK